VVLSYMDSTARQKATQTPVGNGEEVKLEIGRGQRRKYKEKHANSSGLNDAFKSAVRVVVEPNKPVVTVGAMMNESGPKMCGVDGRNRQSRKNRLTPEDRLLQGTESKKPFRPFDFFFFFRQTAEAYSEDRITAPKSRFRFAKTKTVVILAARWERRRSE